MTNHLWIVGAGLSTMCSQRASGSAWLATKPFELNLYSATKQSISTGLKDHILCNRFIKLVNLPICLLALWLLSCRFLNYLKIHHIFYSGKTECSAWGMCFTFSCWYVEAEKYHSRNAANIFPSSHTFYQDVENLTLLSDYFPVRQRTGIGHNNTNTTIFRK